jgi:aryl-alcohol dehydrogenase-like predicted oxidoreductase
MEQKKKKKKRLDHFLNFKNYSISKNSEKQWDFAKKHALEIRQFSPFRRQQLTKRPFPPEKRRKSRKTAPKVSFSFKKNKQKQKRYFLGTASARFNK